MSQQRQSPDYTPILVNLLASEISSSGESMQAYITRKTEGREFELANQPQPTEPRLIVKESESSPITVTPA